MTYRAVIAETLNITPERARQVEGYLRLQYGTLGSLSREDIAREYTAGGISASIDADPSGADALADSFAL